VGRGRGNLGPRKRKKSGTRIRSSEKVISEGGGGAAHMGIKRHRAGFGGEKVIDCE